MTDAEPQGIDCQDFVELITEYLEDVIPAGERSRIDEHLRECPGCATALAQWRVVVRLSGALSEQDVEGLDPQTRHELLEAFRGARPSRSAD